MSQISIACYKPKPGKEHELHGVVKRHLPVLRSEGLATAREAVIMRAKDGTIIEVFEWTSAEAIDAAHKNPQVMKLWDKFGEVCEYLPVGSLEEAQHPFSGFAPFDPDAP